MSKQLDSGHIKSSLNNNPLYQYYCRKKGKINEQNKINYYYQLFKGSGCTKNKCQLQKNQEQQHCLVS
jgi:hypothetical protein